METPSDMHQDIEKEWAYIRWKKEELNDQILRQKKAGMWNYKPGDWLRMYLDPDKTRNKFDKNRHQFKTFGKFVAYKNGNVIAELRGTEKKKVEVPIYYTIPDDPNNHINGLPLRKEEDIIKNAAQQNIEGFEKDEKILST